MRGHQHARQTGLRLADGQRCATQLCRLMNLTHLGQRSGLVGERLRQFARLARLLGQRAGPIPARQRLIQLARVIQREGQGHFKLVPLVQGLVCVYPAHQRFQQRHGLLPEPLVGQLVCEAHRALNLQIHAMTLACQRQALARGLHGAWVVNQVIYLGTLSCQFQLLGGCQGTTLSLLQCLMQSRAQIDMALRQCLVQQRLEYTGAVTAVPQANHRLLQKGHLLTVPAHAGGAVGGLAVNTTGLAPSMRLLPMRCQPSGLHLARLQKLGNIAVQVLRNHRRDGCQGRFKNQVMGESAIPKHLGRLQLRPRVGQFKHAQTQRMRG